MKNNYYTNEQASTPDQNPAASTGYGPGYGTGEGYRGEAGGGISPQTAAAGSGMDFDVTRLLKRLYRHWLVLLVLWLAFAVIGASLEFKKQLVFQSWGKLSLGDDTGRSESTATKMLLGEDPTPNILTQQLILRSDDLACEVIRANGLNAQLWSSDPKVARKIAYRPIFWEWYWEKNQDIKRYASGLVVRQSNVSEDIYSAASYVVKFTDDEHFVVNNSNNMQAIGGSGRLGEPVHMQGADFTLETVGGCKMAKDDTVNFSMQPDFACKQAFEDSLVVQPMTVGTQTSNLIQVGYSSNSPFVAQEVVNSVMKIYLERSQKANRLASQQTYDTITKLLNKVQGDLLTATNNLEEEQKQLQTFTMDPLIQKQVDGVAKLESSIFETKRMLERSKAAEAALKGADPMQGNDRGLVELTLFGDAAVRAAIDDYRSVQRNLHLYSGLNETHPRLLQAKADVAKAWDLLNAVVAGSTRQLEAELARTEKDLGDARKAFDSLPESGRRMAELTSKVEVQQTNYSGLLAEATRANITLDATLSNYSVKDTARPALQASSPVIAQVLSSSLGVAFVLSALMVMLPGLRIRWFETAEEAMKAAPYPVFGVLPSTGQRSRRGERKILVEDPNGRWAESMRLLRTNLMRAMAGKSSQILMVSGAQPGDGKSTVSSNLAVSLAQSSRIKSVLLIDADMHRPSLHGVFGTPQSPGLSDYLNGSATIEQVLHQVEIPGTEGKTIAFIPAGPIPPVPSDLVETDAMQALLAYAREKHTFTVVDTPPYPLVSVAGALAEHVDRVLTVCRVGRTARALYLRHITHLARHGAHLGQIFNTPMAGRLGRGQGYGYGYGYGDGYGDGYGGYGYGSEGYGAKEKKQQAESGILEKPGSAKASLAADAGRKDA